MGKGGKRKVHPRSWQQSAILGGTVTLKGRGVEKDLVVVPMRVAASSPAELEQRVEDALVTETLKREPS